MNGSQPNGAGRYAQIRGTARVHERALFAVARIPSELELQARWFAGDFGRAFVSTNGNRIDIVQFGVWNREAGPDFRDAAIRIDGGEPMHGCIEIDLLDRSWESHGHAINPAFEATALHVFVERSNRAFFTRTLSNRNVPQVCIDPTTLTRALNANVPLAHPGRCQAPLKNLREERVRSVLDAARNSVCDKKQIGFATRSTRMDATKRFSRKSQPRWGTRKTSCRSHFSRNVCRSDYCVKILRIARRCSLAQRVSWRRPTSTSTKSPRANMCDNSGTVGGLIVMTCSDLFSRQRPGTSAAHAR